MSINTLGKVLFPRAQAWQQRRQAKLLVVALMVAVVFAAVIAAIMFMQNSHR